MEPKVDPRAMSEKGIQKGSQNGLFWSHFGSQNRSKIDEKIDARIDAKNDHLLDPQEIRPWRRSDRIGHHPPPAPPPLRAMTMKRSALDSASRHPPIGPSTAQSFAHPPPEPSPYVLNFMIHETVRAAST